MGLGQRKDLFKLDNTLKKIKNPPSKPEGIKNYKLQEKVITTKGPSANKRLLNAAEDAVGSEVWRTPNSSTTRFPKIRKEINKFKAAIGKKGYNLKGQTKADTCVKLVSGMCKSTNIAFPDTLNTRDFVKEQQDKGVKPHSKFKSKPGDIVMFSDKKRNSTTDSDWTGKGPRPQHIGVKGKKRNTYIGSSSGDVEPKGIYRENTRKYKIDFYTPQNSYK